MAIAPVFTAAPTSGPEEFRRPNGWQKLTLSTNCVQLARWKAGWGLMALMGGVVAVVDVDVQHGGDVKFIRSELRRLSVRVFCEIETPGGGRHFWVAGHPELPSVG